MVLELTWTIIPLMISMTIFVWGASIFFKAYRAPKQAMEVYVVGKQWMWKFQHPTGQREINELHVPVGARVKLTMTTEDVIHSFYVPAFRIKQDVVPGRYIQTWFEATKAGKYYLFCAEYCGTNHSGMGGYVDVMEPADYQQWLAGGTGSESAAAQGQKLFQERGCASCHQVEAGGQQGRGPSLYGLFGKPQTIEGGQQRDGGRGVHARVHPQPAGQARRGLPEHHADLPGAAHRGADTPAHRLHTLARADRSRRGRGGLRAGHNDDGADHGRRRAAAAAREPHRADQRATGKSGAAGRARRREQQRQRQPAAVIRGAREVSGKTFKP